MGLQILITVLPKGVQIFCVKQGWIWKDGCLQLVPQWSRLHEFADKKTSRSEMKNISKRFRKRFGGSLILKRYVLSRQDAFACGAQKMATLRSLAHSHKVKIVKAWALGEKLYADPEGRPYVAPFTPFVMKMGGKVCWQLVSKHIAEKEKVVKAIRLAQAAAEDPTSSTAAAGDPTG